METVVIKRGIPLPPSMTGQYLRGRKGNGKLQVLVSQMNVGDMIEVEHTQVPKFRNALKTLGMKSESRKLEAGKSGVWRTA